MTDQPFIQPPPRIRYRATLMTLFSVLQKEYPSIIKCGALPMLMVFVVALLLGGMNPIAQIIYSLGITWCAVALARLLILNVRSASWIPYVGRPTWHYFWRASVIYLSNSLLTALLAVAAGYLLPGITPAILMTGGLIVFMPIALFIFSRFGPAPVAAAVEGDAYFKTAWQKTRGNTLRLMALRITPLLPMVVLVLLLSLVGAKIMTAVVTGLGALVIPMIILPVMDALIYAQLYQGREMAADVA